MDEPEIDVTVGPDVVMSVPRIVVSDHGRENMGHFQHVINPVENHVTAESDTSVTSNNTGGGTGTVLANLVHEELSRIFVNLSIEDRQRFRAVCRKWRDSVDNAFGCKIRVKNSTSELILNTPFAIDVELSSMTQPFKSSAISFAHSLRRLFFSNIVVTYNLVSFLQACSNITYLGFGNVILDLPINDPFSHLLSDNEQIPLANLDTLEVKCFTIVEGVVEILTFLCEKIAFTRLKDVNFVVQNPPVLPFQMLFVGAGSLPEATHPLIKLLFKLRPTLQKFSIGRSSMPTIMKFYPEREDVNFRTNSPQLEQLEIHPYFREEWSPMLAHQERLKIMNLGSCNVSRWLDIQEVVMRNWQSLECFSIGGLSFGQIWDCSIFENCLALKEAAIEISHSNKINLGRFPVQLRNLQMFGPIPKHEIIAIAENIFGLEHLKFTHLGRIADFNNAEEDKVTLEVFKALLQLPHLKTLSFVTCSIVSIDWDLISLWCATVHDTPGFTYSEKYFQSHGEYFRNGINVELSEDFKRETFDWSLVPMISLHDMESVASSHGSADMSEHPMTPRSPNGPDTPRG